MLCAGHNRHLKRCARTGVYIRAESSCDREAAFLERVARKVQTILNHPSLRERIRARILSRWDGTIHELDDQSRAPAVSTGKRDIRLCLKGDPSENAALFVIIHEMAHIACHSNGHTEEFWKIMREILEVARRIGVYTTHDDKARVCGKEIGPEPLR